MQHTTWWGSFNEYDTTLVGFLPTRVAFNNHNYPVNRFSMHGKGEFRWGKMVTWSAVTGEPLLPVPHPYSPYEV